MDDEIFLECVELRLEGRLRMCYCVQTQEQPNPVCKACLGSGEYLLRYHPAPPPRTWALPKALKFRRKHGHFP